MHPEIKEVGAQSVIMNNVSLSPWPRLATSPCLFEAYI